MEAFDVVFGLAGWIVAAYAIGALISERGRRNDVLWFAKMAVRPTEEEMRPEVQPGDDPETEGLREAELQALTDGIFEQARMDGRNVTLPEAREEAERMYLEVGG